MRIAISGTANVGKSTLINDFLNEWPGYTSNRYSYRELLAEKQLSHSKQSTKDTQWMILNNMVDELQKYTPSDKVIFDRCSLDNLIYSLWLHEKGESDVDDSFISKCIPIVRESLKLLDIIFFIPVTRSSPIDIVDNGKRETDPVYILEVDNIFKSVIDQYKFALERTIFFPKDDCPGIIEVFGKPDERIHLMKQYLNTDGDLIGDEGGSVLDPNNVNQLFDLLEAQQEKLVSEKKEKHQTDLVKSFIKKQKRIKV